MVTEHTVVDRAGQSVRSGVSIRHAWLRDPGETSAGRLRSPGPITRQSPAAAGPTLGQAVQARRAELGLTQANLAARVNELGGDMRQSDISRLERGKVTLPRNHRLQQIAEALEVPSGELLALGGWAGAEASFTALPQPIVAPSSSGTSAVRMLGESTGPGQPVDGREQPAADRVEDLLRRCREENDRVRRLLDGEAVGRRLAH